MVEQVIKAGVRVIQLRDKNATKREFFTKALKLKKLMDQQVSKVVFIVNDHLDVALAVGADGVHLGQEDLPVKSAKKIIEASKQNVIVGVSTHNLREALQAERDGADYINLGPIFFTKTKENNYPPICWENFAMLKEIIEKIKIPFSVMGGIKQKHFAPLIAQGVKTVALITEITQQKDISKHVGQLVKAFREERNVFKKKQNNLVLELENGV